MRQEAGLVTLTLSLAVAGCALPDHGGLGDNTGKVWSGDNQEPMGGTGPSGTWSTGTSTTGGGNSIGNSGNGGSVPSGGANLYSNSESGGSATSGGMTGTSAGGSATSGGTTSIGGNSETGGSTPTAGTTSTGSSSLTGGLTSVGGTSQLNSGTGGTCISGSTTAQTGGSCGCGGAPATTTAPCKYPVADSGACPEAICAGWCTVESDSPPTGTLAFQADEFFGYQLFYVPTGSNVVALGAVTSMDSNKAIAGPGKFLLALYEDSKGSPSSLLGVTGELTAQDSSLPVEGALSQPVYIEGGKQYWVFMLSKSFVYLEDHDVTTIQLSSYAYSVTCVPLEPGCAMPPLTSYFEATKKEIIPYLFVKYVTTP